MTRKYLPPKSKHVGKRVKGPLGEVVIVRETNHFGPGRSAVGQYWVAPIEEDGKPGPMFAASVDPTVEAEEPEPAND